MLEDLAIWQFGRPLRYVICYMKTNTILSQTSVRSDCWDPDPLDPPLDPLLPAVIQCHTYFL